MSEDFFRNYFSEMHKITLSGKNEKRDFTLKKLSEDDIPNVLSLQKGVTALLESDEIFIESSKEELLSAISDDLCLGLTDENGLACVCTIILNRKTDSNLFLHHKEEINSVLGESFCEEDFLTFDSIQVRRDCSGFGIQRFFLGLCEDIASVLGAKGIVATVSPKNRRSFLNFEKCGFEAILRLVIEHEPYCGVERIIFYKRTKADA